MQPKHGKGKNRILAFAATLLCNAPLFASHYACEGPVNGVTVSPGGVVAAANAGGQSWGYFCQVGATTNGVSSDACKGILAVLLAAQAAGKTVTLWYDDELTCSTPRGWAWLTTVYWGPTMNN